MRSLFFKIFLWFWLANIIVVSVLFLSDRRTRPSEEDQRRGLPHMMEDLALLYGQQAVSAYQQGGSESAIAYLNHLEASSAIQGYLLQDGKSDFLGRKLPEDIHQQIQGRPRHHPPPDKKGFGHPPPPPPMIISSTFESDGHNYLFIMKIPPGPMHDLLQKPASIIARLVAIICVAGLVCYGLALYLTSPLKKLQFAARRLAMGDFSFRISPSLVNRHDEIGDLGKDFDFMVEQIVSLITGQKRLLRDISHELRSPLTRLNVALELARQCTGEQAKAALDRIELEVERTNELIRQLLSLNRLENNADESKKIKIDLAEILHEVAEDAGFEASDSNRSVSVIHTEECNVIGSPELLRSALENIVRNAIRYTKEGTKVELSLEKKIVAKRAWAMINIRDHGPGLSTDDLKKIFAPFYRVTNSRDRKTGGVGLGLTIAEQAIKVHDGSIEAINAPEGGLIIKIILPLTENNSQDTSENPNKNETSGGYR